jgi:hypothetical protein
MTFREEAALHILTGIAWTQIITSVPTNPEDRKTAAFFRDPERIVNAAVQLAEMLEERLRA